MNPQGQGAATYDPGVALEFFKSAGKAAAVAEGEKIFVENERAIPMVRKNKMYLLLKGEVDLLAGRKSLGKVRPGEIFGEMALISDAPRSASAVAKTPCRVIALDDEAFQAALKKKPEFAMMMMSVMVHRLRHRIADLKAQDALSADAEIREAVAFDPAVLARLIEGLSDDHPLFYQQGQPIVAEGQKGLMMYAVIEGCVAISIAGRVVERLGPGGVFGEAAFVDATATRIANATAETDTSLQPINRRAFLALVKTSPAFGQVMLNSLAERLRFLTARLK
jgi:CRP/FNR family transcriptional regulator, cyclic AMP receptor protein